MSDSIRSIKISADSLDSFAVYEKDFYDITLLPLAISSEIHIECNHYREFTLDDMAQALEHVIENGKSTASFFLAWFEPLIVNFYDNLMFGNLFGNDASSIDAYHMVYMPQTDEDLLRWIITYILTKYRTMTPIHMHLTAADYINAEGLLQMIDYQADECCLPIEERHYIDEVKEDFIRELDNNLILQDSDAFTKKLFRRYVNDLCAKNNYNALRIKGFACSGGNSVFKCDWQEAARCMEILWKDGGFGYAANTLGFMYYDGRLTNGIPDYEEAFKYFSIGHAFGIYESTFKLVDMSLNGVLVSKNYELAGSLIERVYNDTRYRFEDGDFEGAFAEAAMHMGEVQLKAFSINPESPDYIRAQAYGFFLQAKYALSMRAKFGTSISDRELAKKIDKYIVGLIGDFKIRKSSLKSSYPGPLKDFIQYRTYGKFELSLKQLKNQRIKVTVTKLPERGFDEPQKTLLTYREFGCCSLTDTISIIAEDALASTFQEKLVFDDILIDINIGKRSGIVFLSDDKTVATLEAERFTISKPKK